MRDVFHVSRGDDGISVLEIWNREKKLTVYLPEILEILQIYGTDVNARITDAQVFYESWQWLHKEQADE